MKGLFRVHWQNSIAMILLTLPIWVQLGAQSQTTSPTIASFVPLSNPTPILSSDEIETLSRKITVKIHSSESSGSGIVIAKEGNIYTVLTNRHVLPSGNYTIQTSEEPKIPATQIAPPMGSKQDSALLQFKSNRQYPIAKLGNSQTLKTGEKLYIAGFPVDRQDADSSGWRFTQGLVLMRSDLALEDGYQLSYTNATVRGMSGGPVLNSIGEVVALHGQGSALIDLVFKNEQGQDFCNGMQQFIAKYSWGIPIERVLPSRSQPYSAPRRSESLLDPVNFYAFEQLIPFDQLVVNAEVMAAKSCQLPSSRWEPRPIQTWRFP